MHLTVGVFGDQELAKRMGKKGTQNDIAIYNHGSCDGVITYVCPNSDKVQPLLHVLGMIDVPVIVVKDMTRELGEMLIGIDEMKFDTGFIITESKDTVQQFIKGTSLEKFEFTEEKELRQKLLLVDPKRSDEVWVPVDNYFNVKGVGTVVLGIVRSGNVCLHDRLMVEPVGREVTVKGIQSQDKDYKETEPGMRVGLNLKGVEADELKRGYVICKECKKSSEISVKFTKNRFFKDELKQGTPVHVNIGVQVVTFEVQSVGDIVKLKSNQQVAYKENQRCVIATQNNVMPRIIGSGLLV